MSLFKAKVPPSRVPTLTEVVEFHDVLTEEVVPVVAPVPDAVSEVAASVVAPPEVGLSMHSVNAELLTNQVMADMQRQVDAMLEVRMKEALAPIVTRLTDALARDARSELAKVMKDVVARCVAEEIRRAKTTR